MASAPITQRKPLSAFSSRVLFSPIDAPDVGQSNFPDFIEQGGGMETVTTAMVAAFGAGVAGGTKDVP